MKNWSSESYNITQSYLTIFEHCSRPQSFASMTLEIAQRPHVVAIPHLRIQGLGGGKAQKNENYKTAPPENVTRLDEGQATLPLPRTIHQVTPVFKRRGNILNNHVNTRNISHIFHVFVVGIENHDAG